MQLKTKNFTPAIQAHTITASTKPSHAITLHPDKAMSKKFNYY